MNTTSRTEWAAELTWPDGHTELRADGDSRRSAEVSVDHHNDPDTDLPKVTARLVTRTVTTSAWVPVDGQGL